MEMIFLDVIIVLDRSSKFGTKVLFVKFYLKNIQVISLVFSKLRVYLQFCSVLCLEKRRSLVLIYQNLDSTDFYLCFSKNQLET